MKTAFSRTIGNISLSARVSLLLMLAALIPLIVTITSSEFFSRPQLIAQADASMESDAQTHIQTIENYFSQPIIDVRSLSQNSLLAEYLSGNAAVSSQASSVLETGYQRNTNYINWSLIDTNGVQRLFYPAAPQMHGKYLIPPETVKTLSAANTASISSDYYDPQGNALTVDITEPVEVISTSKIQILGYLRATLNINFLWSMMLGENGENGTGSYAFIVDENGVVIAHSDMSQVFKAVASFTPSEQGNITTLERYGANTNIAVSTSSELANEQGNVKQQATFQTVPPGEDDSYQVIGLPVSIVPWTYYVLSPTSIVTSLADQQLLGIGIIGFIVLLLAAITGIIVGRRLTSPVLSSVTQLQLSSQTLKEVAAKEQTTITEQLWVVDSSKTGLTAVNHYIDATQAVINRIIATSMYLENHWSDIPPKDKQKALYQTVAMARYVQAALHHQKSTSQKLSATLDLASQVTDQLSTSAELATSTAEQMEQVVSQLQQVVGKSQASNKLAKIEDHLLTGLANSQN